MLFKCRVAVWGRKWGFEIPETDFFFLKALLLSDVNSLPCSSVLVPLFFKSDLSLPVDERCSQGNIAITYSFNGRQKENELQIVLLPA